MKPLGLETNLSVGSRTCGPLATGGVEGGGEGKGLKGVGEG